MWKINKLWTNSKDQEFSELKCRGSRWWGWVVAQCSLVGIKPSVQFPAHQNGKKGIAVHMFNVITQGQESRGRRIRVLGKLVLYTGIKILDF